LIEGNACSRSRVESPRSAIEARLPEPATRSGRRIGLVVVVGVAGGAAAALLDWAILLLPALLAGLIVFLLAVVATNSIPGR